MEKIKAISNWIENYSTEIIENIEQESIDVYNFLKSEFQTSNVKDNYLFQFIFRSFYRLDNAGLSKKFKIEYFQILENYRSEKVFDFNFILTKLYQIPNRKGQNTFQFSFTTKMANTIDHSMPIYDSEVAKMFSFKKPYQNTFEIKLDKYLQQLQEIKNGYTIILEQNLVPKTLQLFDQTFENNKLTEMKKLDFIFWSGGKLKSKFDE